MNSMHFFRQGVVQEDSAPTILVSTKSGANEVALRQKISDLVEESLRCSLRISFQESSVRRTINTQLPPICTPRNTSSSPYPEFGASIGIRDRDDSTATLGGFLSIDGRTLLLTVDHLIPDDLANDVDIYITHPSEQETRTTLKESVGVYFKIMERCCETCRDLKRQYLEVGDFKKAVEIATQSVMCEAAKSFLVKVRDLCIFCPDTLGRLFERSEFRSRQAIGGKDYMTEMDWALFDTEKWPTSLESHARDISKGLFMSKVIPGALVKATGRTSGLQMGVINTSRSIINHGGRFTQEWSVIREPQLSLLEWIEGGIGVDGDSGAWIIDGHNDALYGMVWGRDQPATNPICLFSSIEDIVEDIKERTGAESAYLPRSRSSDKLLLGNHKGTEEI
jgi:hypothetical protein